MSITDIAAELGAAASKSAPLKETTSAYPSSLAYSLVRSVSEASIISSNTIVSLAVFSFRVADAKEGGVLSVTTIVLVSASSTPQPLDAS